jgi:hypothetical protein
MARQRASQARAAFARVGTASVRDVPAIDSESTDASISASQKDGNEETLTAIGKAGVADGGTAVRNASRSAARAASSRAGKSAGHKAGKARRRVGRPRGPERVPLTIRILAATDERLTAAVEATGDSPQYIVDAALAAYLDALGIPAGR